MELSKDQNLSRSVGSWTVELSKDQNLTVPILPAYFNIDLLWYMSGPMSGIPEYNYPHFETCSLQLRLADVKLISPHEMFVKEEARPGGMDWTHYMRANIRHLTHCKGLILLKGWPYSVGANTELQIAQKLKFPIWFYDNYTLTEM